MMKFITPILFATLFVGASADTAVAGGAVAGGAVAGGAVAGGAVAGGGVIGGGVSGGAPLQKPLCTPDDPGDMDSFMIKKVGKTLPDPLDKSFPFSKAFFIDDKGDKTDSTDPDRLVTHVYVEFHEDKLIDADAAAGETHMGLIGGFQNVYVGVLEEDEDCAATGTIVETSWYNPITLKINDYDYASLHPPTDASTCFPSTTQGRVTKIAFAVKGPLKEGSPFLQTNPAGERTIEFCYRIGFKQTNGDVVSYKDTKVSGAVSVEGVFGSFDTPVKIEEPDATKIDTTVASKVEVTVALCNKLNEMTNGAKNKQYQIGQNFRLCVESADAEYEVESFTEVSCGSRQLVVESAVTDDLSVIFDHPNAAGTRFALRSVITAAIITEGKTAGEITCTGTVTLMKKDTTTDDSTGDARNLQISSGSEPDDESVATPFDLKLNLVTPNVNLNIESSASLPSSITATAVALVGFVVALFL